MTGVVLAGGQGTRLRPLTYITNKHLLPVYNRPMIDYPLYTLRKLGCDNVVIVSGAEHIGAFAMYLGTDYTYRVQDTANGIAGALKCAKGLVEGVFPVILGDNYFEKVPVSTEPTIYTHEVDDPQRFGVYHERHIVEKPVISLSKEIVTGLYYYDQRVFDIIDTLTPSARGELEITDVNNWYLDHGAKVKLVTKFWSDMGTFDSLNDVSNFERNHK